jgi:hypothetical protein
MYLKWTFQAFCFDCFFPLALCLRDSESTFEDELFSEKLEC